MPATRVKNRFDVRDRSWVRLLDGIYDGMRCYNVGYGVRELHLPCKTFENGVTIQVYQHRDGDVYEWVRYETEAEHDPSQWSRHGKAGPRLGIPHRASFDSPNIEFISIGGVNQGVMTTLEKKYLIELGCMIHRLRYSGVAATITLLNDRGTEESGVLKPLVDMYGLETKVVEFPPASKIKYGCYGLKTKFIEYCKPTTTLAIYIDVDLLVMRPCSDWLRDLENQTLAGSVVMSVDKIQTIERYSEPDAEYHDLPGEEQWSYMHEHHLIRPGDLHFNTTYIAANPQHPLTKETFRAWFQEWERFRIDDELSFTRADATLPAAKVPRAISGDQRYNRFVMSIFHRYQLGLERENLWLDDVCGLQGHLAVTDVSTGLGTKKRIRNLLFGA